MASSGAEALHVLQSMIDVSAERLDGLRTHCATSAELTQQEIRTLEVSRARVPRLRLIVLSLTRPPDPLNRYAPSQMPDLRFRLSPFSPYLRYCDANNVIYAAIESISIAHCPLPLAPSLRRLSFSNTK